MSSLTSRFFLGCNTDSRNQLSAGGQNSACYSLQQPLSDVCVVHSPFLGIVLSLLSAHFPPQKLEGSKAGIMALHGQKEKGKPREVK